jgi:CDGSH-type Zn-finger protein
MARLIRLEGTGPIKIEPQAKPIWVCACGLSKTFPICDGTHKTCVATEQAGMLHVYDAARQTVVETRPDMS